MNILIVHQNFPGQYLHLARRLVAKLHRVVAISQRGGTSIPGVEHKTYSPEPVGTGVHPYVIDIDDAVRCAVAVAELCQELALQGFTPDVVLGHSGWGEILYIKDVWPGVPVLGYFEFFYSATQSDMDFDAEFPPAPDAAMRLRARNAVALMGLDAADWGITPTRWQRDRYPPQHRSRMSIVHDGVDTEVMRPDANACLWLSGGRRLHAGGEFITFSARNMEPYRGFHSFMRALPEILRRRPRAHCLIAGGDGVSYGRPPEGHATWREAMLAELGDRLDLARVHFLGPLPAAHYTTLLQISAVHVYLTYPFVLSWSLLEALSTGCAVVASRTPPVEELINQGENGRLVDFFDTASLADEVSAALHGGAGVRDMRVRARESMLRRYDLRTICLPAQLALLHDLAVGRGAGSAMRASPQPLPPSDISHGRATQPDGVVHV